MSPRRAPLSAWIRSILFVVLMALVTVPYSLVTVAVRPLPAEGEDATSAWWARLDVPRLQVVARLRLDRQAPVA